MTNKLTVLSTGVATCVAFFIVTVMAPSANAAPDTNQCVSRAEYRAIKPDMKMSQVRQIVNGQEFAKTSDNNRQYVACFTESPGSLYCVNVTTKAGGTLVKRKGDGLCVATGGL